MTSSGGGQTARPFLFRHFWASVAHNHNATVVVRYFIVERVVVTNALFIAVFYLSITETSDLVGIANIIDDDDRVEKCDRNRRGSSHTTSSSFVYYYDEKNDHRVVVLASDDDAT